MAWPFGKPVTLAMYIDWARKHHGFQAQSGTCPDSQGKTHTFVRIFKPNGPSFFAIGVSQNAPLYPSYIESINRKLGLSYPTFAKPEHDEQ